MVFRCDDGAGLSGGGQHRLGIQGFDAEEIQHPDPDALLLQTGGGFQGLVHLDAAGQDGCVLPLGQLLCFADGEGLRLRVDARPLPPEEAQVAGGGQRRQLGDEAAEGLGVRRLHHRHGGTGPQDGDVLIGGVGAPVKGAGHAGVASHNADGVAAVGAAHVNLVAGPAGGKDAEGMDEGLLPLPGHASRHPHHVGLLYPAVEDSLRALFPKAGEAQGGHQVRIQGHHGGVSLHALLQGPAVDFPHLRSVQRISLRYLVHPAASSRSRRRCSSWASASMASSKSPSLMIMWWFGPRMAAG